MSDFSDSVFPLEDFIHTQDNAYPAGSTQLPLPSSQASYLTNFIQRAQAADFSPSTSTPSSLTSSIDREIYPTNIDLAAVADDLLDDALAAYNGFIEEDLPDNNVSSRSYTTEDIDDAFFNARNESLEPYSDNENNEPTHKPIIIQEEGEEGQDLLNDEYEGTIPPPPASRSYDSLDEVIQTLQAFFLSNGAAIVKSRTSNHTVLDGIKQPLYCKLICDRGSSKPPRGAGLRAYTTSKTNCPFYIITSATRKSGYRWSYTAHGEHNHPPSLGPAAHPSHRKRTERQNSKSAELYRFRDLQARQLVAQVRSIDPDRAHFIARDIYNG